MLSGLNVHLDPGQPSPIHMVRWQKMAKKLQGGPLTLAHVKTGSCCACRYFSDTMEAMIAEARSEGRHERGPINLQATAVHVASRTEIHVEAGTRMFTFNPPETCDNMQCRVRMGLSVRRPCYACI